MPASMSMERRVMLKALGKWKRERESVCEREREIERERGGVCERERDG